MIRSSILEKQGSTDIGLNFASNESSPVLKIGDTHAISEFIV